MFVNDKFRLTHWFFDFSTLPKWMALQFSISFDALHDVKQTNNSKKMMRRNLDGNLSILHLMHKPFAEWGKKCFDAWIRNWEIDKLFARGKKYDRLPRKHEQKITENTDASICIPFPCSLSAALSFSLSISLCASADLNSFILMIIPEDIGIDMAVRRVHGHRHS